MSRPAGPTLTDPARHATLVLALGLSWGLNWPAVRIALDEMPLWTLRTAGLAGGAALMFAFFLATGRPVAVPRRYWLRLACVGLLSVAGFNILSASAQLALPSSRAVILAYTMPIWAVLLARIVLGEPLDRTRLVGVALGAVGLAVLAVPLARTGEAGIGLVYAVGSGLSWAAGSVVLKRWPIPCSPPLVTAWQLALAAALAGAVALGVDGWPDSLPTRPGTWAGLAYNVVIGQALATTLWFYMLDNMPAGIASVASLVVPVVGTVGATLIIGERPTPLDWVGLAFILAASASVVFRPPAAPATERSRG